MGSLIYDGLAIDLDDRTLAHLQLAIVQKLRRNESFLLSWKDAVATGSGRTAIWLHPSIPLRFKFSGSRLPTINTDWITQLTDGANSPRGLIVGDETGTVQQVHTVENRDRRTTMMNGLSST